jgi:hypothetical protein
MIGKNSGFSPKSISAMSAVLLLSLSFVAYGIVNAQTEPSDTPTNNPTRTTSLDSSSIAPTGEVGTTTGEVGTTTGEVGTTTGEVGTTTGEVVP